MKSGLIAAATLAALGLAGAAFATAAQAADVEVRNAVARVVVVPEAGRTEIKVEIVPGAARLPVIDVHRAASGKIIVDGGLEHDVRGCRRSGINRDAGDFNPVSPPDNVVIQLRGRDDVALKDAPLITIRTPMDVHVDAGEGVFGAVGRADSVHLGVSGCGDWTVANVKGDIDVSAAGSGDVHTGSAGGSAKASIAGSGDVRFGAVKALKASIAGSGDVSAAEADGSVDASIAGSGDVVVRGGHIDRVKVSIAGSGDVTVKAAVNDVDATIMGSGDVKVASAAHVSKMVMGSGSVIVGN
jgi:hypothetical protein